MKFTALTLAALLAAGAAQAADFTFSGQASFHNDKVVIDFSVAAGQTVTFWTDSWQSGLNFDPQLFVAAGDALLASDNDGGSLVNAAAGYFDAGLVFTAPSSASYRLILNASSNDALGSRVSDGFTYDADTPIALADWNQPGYDINKNDQKGGFWRVHLSGVETAAAVPEPAAWAFLLPGLLTLTLAARRR